MITFSIKTYNENYSQLVINDKFVKYIKKEEIPAFIQELKILLDNESLIPIKNLQEYRSNVDDENAMDILQLWTCGKDKKPINLPEEVQNSVGEKLVTHSYRDLTNFAKFWDSYSKDKQFSLYEQLSQDLIEVPYVDDPNDFIYSFGKTAFHPNHGTSHAIRQVEYTRNYLEQVKCSGNAIFKMVANSINSEEQACLELAAFLFRSGRTNEAGWGDDSTYGKRSAAIFKQVALELEFNQDLVKLIASSCFDYHAALEIIDPPDMQDKIILFRKLLKLSHESDLVRCFTDYNAIKAPIVAELSSLLDAESGSPESIADRFLDYAVTLCKSTGSPVTGASESSQNTVLSKKLEVDSANMPKKTLYKLLSFKPSSLPQFVSPTQAWIESEEHTQPHNDSFLVKAHDKDGMHTEDVTAGWKESDIALIPTQQCIEIENKYLSTHVTAYHATTKASYALDFFCRQLKILAKDANNTAWVRDFHSKPKGTLFTNIEDIKERLSGSEIDNKEGIAWHLLSCNPSLWQNSDYDSMESSVDYYFINTSVLRLPFKDMIFTLLDNEGLLVGQEQKRSELFSQFEKLVTDEKTYGKQGVMYQYSIPHELVDEVAYISGKNGSVDVKNPSALDTLLKLKTKGGNPENMNTMQVRLFVPKLLDPKNASHIEVNNYVNMSNELREQFESSIKGMAELAYNGPTEKIEAKPIQEIPIQSAYPSFTFFSDVPTKKLTYDLAPIQKKEEVTTKNSMDDDFDPLFGNGVIECDEENILKL